MLKSLLWITGSAFVGNWAAEKWFIGVGPGTGGFVDATQSPQLAALVRAGSVAGVAVLSRKVLGKMLGG